MPTIHHPPHVYLNDTWYFISSATNRRECLLHVAGHKDLARDQLKQLVVEFHVSLAAWVILDNHYHLLLKSRDASKLSTFFGRLHGRISFELNRLDGTRGRQVWHNFWDTCIRTERDYWTRFNYIHHNPVKHGYVSHMADWEFSSYRYYLEHKGEEWLMDAFNQHPIIDFSDPKDQF